MWLSWLSQLLLEPVPNNLTKLKRLRECHLTRYTSLPLILFLVCSVFCGVFCDDFAIPLGSEINAFSSGNNQNWVSKNGFFAFGFLAMNGDDDMNEYVVGVMYNLGDESVNLPVWTVGGGLRVSQNSVLRLAMDGGIVLVDNLSKITMWSSDTSNLGVQKASLFDNGNFVLLGSKDEVVWESFANPTNTLLPGQSLQFPQTLRALSSKSISSYYSLVITPSGELRLEWEHNVTYWHTQLSSKEAIFDRNGLFGSYNARNKAAWSVTSKDYRDPSVTLRHLRIDRDGNLRIYSFDRTGRVWKPVWQALDDQCSVFGSCGLYSICGYNSTGPVCECLNPDPLGCRKTPDLSSCWLHASVLTINKTVLYGLYPSRDDEMLLSETGCRDFCSKDAGCFASTSMNDGSGRCTVKRTGFLSGYKGPYVHAVTFLKVCSVPQAAVATVGGTKTSRKGVVEQLIAPLAFIALLTVLVVSSIQILIFTILYRRRKIGIPIGKKGRASVQYDLLVRLSFEEVRELTDDFTEKIGASVFRGALLNGMPIVAKVLNDKDMPVSEKEFRIVVSSLSRTHHRNLASVKGFCFEGSNKVLLREFMANGSLDEWLLDASENRYEGRIWDQKVDIALGIARGLAYLHSECQKCITHGSLKLENVLFDENMVPKLTDFGLRDFHSSSSESPSERDIYALGLLFLQILACKREVEGENMETMLDRVNREWKFLDGDRLEVFERMARISFWCMQGRPFLRPSIGEVVKVLEGTLSVDRPPSLLASSHEAGQGHG